MADACPVVQRDDVVDDAQPDAGIASVTDDTEGVSLGGNLNPLHIFLHISGQTAGIAGEDKAHLLCLLHIGDRGGGAHQDDVRVAQLLGEILRDIQAVAAAGVAEDDVLAHVRTSLNK